MALLIDKRVEVFPGIFIDEVYLRIEYGIDQYGKSINCILAPYASRESYISDRDAELVQRSDLLKIDGIPSGKLYGYDKDVEGTDVLTIVHDNVKHTLSTDSTKREMVLDPSTGEPVIDPSTGQPEYETIIVIPKFAMDASISIVDIN